LALPSFGRERGFKVRVISGRPLPAKPQPKRRLVARTENLWRQPSSTGIQKLSERIISGWRTILMRHRFSWLRPVQELVHLYRFLFFNFYFLISLELVLSSSFPGFLIYLCLNPIRHLV